MPLCTVHSSCTNLSSYITVAIRYSGVATLFITVMFTYQNLVLRKVKGKGISECFFWPKCTASFTSNHSYFNSCSQVCYIRDPAWYNFTAGNLKRLFS